MSLSLYQRIITCFISNDDAYNYNVQSSSINGECECECDSELRMRVSHEGFSNELTTLMNSLVLEIIQNSFI